MSTDHSANRSAPFDLPTLDAAEIWDRLTPVGQRLAGMLLVETLLCNRIVFEAGGIVKLEVRPWNEGLEIAISELELIFNPWLTELTSAKVLPLPNVIGRVCRICGCSEFDPCDPPCAWVEIEADPTAFPVEPPVPTNLCTRCHDDS